MRPCPAHLCSWLGFEGCVAQRVDHLNAKSDKFGYSDTPTKGKGGGDGSIVDCSAYFEARDKAHGKARGNAAGKADGSWYQRESGG